MAQTLARDTTPDAEARQIAFFRQRQPFERLAITFDLTTFTVASSVAAIRRVHPDLSPFALAQLVALLRFGPEARAHVRQAPTIEGRMSIPAAVEPVIRVFRQLHISYYVGGSIASTAYSLPRSTYDVDIAAALEPRHVVPFAAALEVEYYLDRGDILDAIARAEAAFNITHHATGINIDIFVTANRPFDRLRYERAQEHMLPGATEPIKLASVEDMILNKLVWYRQDGIESDKQWRDVQAIIRVQDQLLDLPYLRRWATELNISPLLEAALRGDPPPRADTDELPHQGRLF